MIRGRPGRMALFHVLDIPVSLKRLIRDAYLVKSLRKRGLSLRKDIRKDDV